jgi:phage tail-like protein
MPDLERLRFRAETDPLGPAIDLIWELLAPDQPPEDTPLLIRRRERRFPGKSRRGVVPVVASGADQIDGLLVYDTATFSFDFEETWEEREGDRLIAITRQYLYQGSPPDRTLVRSIRREFAEQGGTRISIRTTVRAIDRQGLAPGGIYYYTAFVGPSPNPTFSRLTQAAVLATGRSGRSLFASLPQIHQRLDAAPPPPFSVARADQAKGQLERFLEVFEAHIDMFQGAIDGLRDMHVPRRADSRLLPQLAHLIGWQLKDYLDEDAQRNEIGFAPEVYQTVGTALNIAAMINRLTSWDARVREFVRNVLLSFDAKRLEQLEAGALIYLDGSLAPNPAPPPALQGRRVPAGSANTADSEAMFKLRSRAFDDSTAYSYDCGKPDGQGGYQRDDNDWYNRETIGVYIIPDVETEFFSLLEEWERVRQLLAEFLPIQVRAVFVLQPGVVVEEEYDAVQMVTESFADQGMLVQEETYGEGVEDVSDRIPGWRWFVSNNLAHRTVDTVAVPVDTSSRTWHTGLDQGL